MVEAAEAEDSPVEAAVTVSDANSVYKARNCRLLACKQIFGEYIINGTGKQSRDVGKLAGEINVT